MTPLAVGVEQAAALIGVSKNVVREYIKLGLLPVVKLPSASSDHRGERSRRVLIAVADLEAFVDQHRVLAPAPDARLSEAAVEGWRRSPVRRRKGEAA
jgi:hypothetical protein